MSKAILITGGAASGKSRWAASYFAACDYVLYLCTADEMDPDIMHRIEFSSKQNMVEWDIRTGITNDPVSRFTDHKFIIFDSLGSYTSRTIQKMCPDTSHISVETQKKIQKKIVDDFQNMYDKLEEIDGSMIVVTLETGFSVLPEDHSKTVFREILGNVNQRIANMSNEVYLSASGIQFQIK